VITPPTIVQFLGQGAEGDTVLGLLDALQGGSSDKSLSIRTASRCRTCVTLLDKSTGDATEIIEPSGTVSAEEQSELLSRLQSACMSDKAAGVALMGTMPPGCSSQLYASIVETVCDSNSKVSPILRPHHI
jgi:fructose-1-phosphate kinase PfkB-like protein